MRVAVLNWTRRRVAGAEGYLAAVIAGLRRAGHTVELASEVDSPTDRGLIATAEQPEWCVTKVGPDRLIAQVRSWRPDVLYGLGLLSPALEERFLGIAPSAFLTLGFYGTCISGAKSFKAPIARPCDRQFGWRCLLQYYPHRCGGWSPITMVRDYSNQSRRLALLLQYAAIVTPSHRMEAEYINHGIPRARVHRVPICVEESDATELQLVGTSTRKFDNRLHIVFLGRMTSLKGGHLLLSALPQIRSKLQQEIRVTFAGDGPDRVPWERQAALLRGQNTGLDISFTGWLPPNQRDAVLDSSDLLVVPSVWPDPFPLVGIEAGRRGVPAAGFAVGGIPDWLESGVNGFLAPADPPTSQGLAEAVVKCLRDPKTLAGLRRGALELSRRWSLVAHLAQLEPILASIAGQPPVGGATNR